MLSINITEVGINMEQAALKGKLIIKAKLRLVTGMHIGASNDFAPIGAVDSTFIRDPFTKQPIIPGSSQKGKMRTLLAKARQRGYVLNSISEDDEVVKRLFGSAEKNNARPARLQFYDIFMTPESIAQVDGMDTDTYIGEVKFENTISRLTAVANPRQIERVPAGSEFDFKLVYNIERPEEIDKDMEILTEAFSLLQIDYLGGHGSRGYGRVGFHDFSVELFSLDPAGNDKINIEAVNVKLAGSCLL